jgi:hypothetical protein
VAQGDGAKCRACRRHFGVTSVSRDRPVGARRISSGTAGSLSHAAGGAAAVFLECIHRPATPDTEPAMNPSFLDRLAGFFSAALLTLAMLAGVNALAVNEAPAELLAKAVAGSQG